MHDVKPFPVLRIFLAFLLLLAGLLPGRHAAAQTSWVDLAGGAPGLTNDGQTRTLTWLWTPGGASISGTVDITRTGAGLHFVLAESQLATIVDAYPASGPYDNSPYANSLGGAAGIRHFGSVGEFGRGTDDMPHGTLSTTVIDVRFDGSVSAPNNTILALFDPGAVDPVRNGPATYRFAAFYRGAPVDTSGWTVTVVDPYLPAMTPANWTWDAPSATYRLETYPSASRQPDLSDYNFPDTLVFIDTRNTTFDRLVLTADGLAADTMAIGIGSANRPKLPITLDATWVNGRPADAVDLAIAGAGADGPTGGSSTAPATISAALANGAPNQQVTVRETFTRGAASHYGITWSCRRLDNNVVVASGTGDTGSFQMPPDTGVGCGFVNTGRASLRLEKALPFGRTNPADQFELSITGTGAPPSVTTTGAGNTATGAVVVATPAIGSSYTFTEIAAGGANLGTYGSNWSCTNARADGQQPNGSGTSFSLAPLAGDDLACTFRNSVRPAADLRVRKSVNPAGGRTGEVLTYTLVADDLGPDPANGALLRDAPGAGLDCTRPVATAACTASGGAACPAPTLPVASLLGSGALLPALPVGGSVTLTLQCTVTATP